MFGNLVLLMRLTEMSLFICTDAMREILFFDEGFSDA